MDINDLLKEAHDNHDQRSNEAAKASQRPQVTPEKKEEELEAKMSEMKRRDTEAEVLEQARSLEFGYVSLQSVIIDVDALQVIRKNQAQELQVVCFFFVPHQELRIAAIHPERPELQSLVKQLKHKHDTEVKLYMVSSESFHEAVQQYDKLPKISKADDTVEILPEDIKRFEPLDTLSKLEQFLQKANATEMVNAIVATALKFEASDIHLESEQHQLIIRYRLDGVLHHAASVDSMYYKPITSRIKLLSGLKINVIDRPQDGHFIISMPSGRVDVRVSTLPTNFGESVVMRILRSDMGQLKIADLGLLDHDQKTLEREIDRPNGMIVVCGPTGSGKTTTLYSILAQLNAPERKIVTVEDPIEYQVDGINQSQVNAEKHYTFAVALRSLVRQDPDVILVGEMRDDETVEIAINAALTGHLVLSTIHTNDAAGAIPRFLAMNAKPYLLAPSLNAVVAQRLVRKLCTICKQEIQLGHDDAAYITEQLAQLPDQVKEHISSTRVFYAPQTNGCAQCHGLGYKGRIGIFEIFTMSGELERMIMGSEMSEHAIREQLAKQNVVTMIQDGIIKSLQGITSIEEVFRVVDIKRA